jgi:hypothetical protein
MRQMIRIKAAPDIMNIGIAKNQWFVMKSANEWITCSMDDSAPKIGVVDRSRTNHYF